MPACKSKVGFVEARPQPIFAVLDQEHPTPGQEVRSTLPATDPSTAPQPSRERELQLPELDRQGRLLGPS